MPRMVSLKWAEVGEDGLFRDRVAAGGLREFGQVQIP